KTAGHFTTLNVNNLDAGLRIFNLGTADESAVVEFLETGLTDWSVVFEQGKPNPGGPLRPGFDHPQLCVPSGHATNGTTVFVDIPAVGSAGGPRLATFEEQLHGTAGLGHPLNAACTMTAISGVPINY